MANNAALLKPGQAVVFEGDSLTSRRTPPCLDTWPFLRLSNWDWTYTDRVEEWVFCNRPDLRIKFRNAAVGGSCCRDLSERLERCVLPFKPDWVIMTLGANDANRKIPLTEFKSRMDEFCRRIAQECGGRVMHLAHFKPCPLAPEGTADQTRRTAPYWRAMRSILGKYKGISVDVGTPLQKKARHLVRQYAGHTVYSDGGHFNALGNEIIAAQVLQALGVMELIEA